MVAHLPSDHANPAVSNHGRVLSPSEDGMHHLIIRQRAKAIIQTRMLMIRYSAIMSETENRAAWGDR